MSDRQPPVGGVPIEFRPSAELYPFQSRWFRSSAGMIHYVDEGEGPPLVFLHGNPTWSFLYRNIIRELRQRFRCIAVDYPGFGLSGHPEQYGYTAAEHAAIVGELLHHLDPDPFVVVGQDWGGPIGIAVAASMPERLRGFTFGNTWFWPTDRAFNRLFSHAMSSKMGQWAILDRNVFVTRFIPAGVSRKLTDEEMRHYRAVQPDRSARKGAAEFPRELTRAQQWLSSLEHAVRDVLSDKPLLLVWGMRDQAFSPRWCLPRWKQAFPDHELVELPEAKHYIQEDAPHEIATAITQRFG